MGRQSVRARQPRPRNCYWLRCSNKAIRGAPPACLPAIMAPVTVRSAGTVLLLQLWDLLALLVVYYACTRWGGPWLRDNWLAVAGPVAGALFVAEVGFGRTTADVAAPPKSDMRLTCNRPAGIAMKEQTLRLTRLLVPDCWQNGPVPCRRSGPLASCGNTRKRRRRSGRQLSQPRRSCCSHRGGSSSESAFELRVLTSGWQHQSGGLWPFDSRCAGTNWQLVARIWTLSHIGARRLKISDSVAVQLSVQSETGVH